MILKAYLHPQGEEELKKGGKNLQDKARQAESDAASASKKATRNIKDFGKDLKLSAKDGLESTENKVKGGLENARRGAEAEAGRISERFGNARSSLSDKGELKDASRRSP